MNPEVQTIIRRMEQLVPEIDSININNHPAMNNALTILSSRLLVLLADEQAKSAAKMERFTWWLVCFTIALVFIGVVQTVRMFYTH